MPACLPLSTLYYVVFSLAGTSTSAPGEWQLLKSVRTPIKTLVRAHTAYGHVVFPTVSIRIKSVTNIEKITKSMKMVSAAKFRIAERELKPARAYGEGAQGSTKYHV